MAPSFVLLERDICINPYDAVSGGVSIRWPWDRDDPPSSQEITDVTTEYLRTFKPHVVVADPPELSFLHVLRPEPLRLPGHLQNISSCYISSADKNLVALYAGAYRPGSRFLQGGYLIYDASKDCFSVIPELSVDPTYQRALGAESAVVMCEAAGDDYVLAELVGVWVWPEIFEAELWLWKSSAQEWVLKPGRVPLPSTTTHHFSSDLCFSYQGTILCWVDLLKGMVLCHLDQDCKFSFVPLPQDCPEYDESKLEHRVRHGSSDEFRSMACVRGHVKFVVLDACVPNQPDKGLELTLWTLSPDLSGWNLSSKYSVENIWANEAYQPIGIPKLAPKFPVLSIHEDGVVYLILNHLGEREYLGQSFIRVDMYNNKVQFYPSSVKWSIQSQLFASEFTAHRQRSRDHPREIEGSEVGASAKRMKP